MSARRGGFPATLMSPTSFVQSPVRWLKAISRARATTGRKRDTNATCSCTPAVSQAATMAWASSRVVAIGFSQSTCLPWAAASSTCARWSAFALHTSTASADRTSSSASGAAAMPKSCRIHRVCSG